MTSREFIQRQFGNNDGKEKWCSSILKAANGDIYSYGYHYPLLFTINGQVFRNVRGYSVTTAKHIGWCYGFGATDVELETYSNFSYLSDFNKLEVIIRTMRNKLERIEKELAAKKRKDTQVYSNLSIERATTNNTLNFLTELITVTA